jgi:phosphate transport system protein
MSPKSPRETFDRHLQTLLDEVLILGSLVEQAVLQSVAALQQGDLSASRRIQAADWRINEKRYEIETETLILIATQQPMARDLRLLAAVLEIITELERIGDYAKGIARINLLLGEPRSVKIPIQIQEMTEMGLDMLHRALGAFVARDAQVAYELPKEDDQVDRLYNQVYRELLQAMLLDPSKIDRSNYLIWAAHNLERLADRVTNICERIVFVVTGEVMELDHQDGLQLGPSQAPNLVRRSVLFLCTGNSCRSQMAEAIVNTTLGQQWQAFSAGTQPADQVHPKARQVLSEIGIQHSGRPKNVTEFADADFDVVVTVCDQAAEACPLWLGAGRRVHLGFPDPAKATGSEEEVLAVFRAVREAIAQQIPNLLKTF